MSVLRRLSVLRDEAEREPVPQRKFFHVGQPEVMEDIGECVPMIAWVDDNLSRFVVSDAPSSSWGRREGGKDKEAVVIALPNHAVVAGDGVFLVTGAGADSKTPHPGGKGHMHFVHLGVGRRIWDKPGAKIHLYRLEGVQTKGFGPKR